MTPEDRDQLASEYVLGTLSVEERAEATTLAASDPVFRAAIVAWQQRLAPLDEATPAVVPPPAVWHRIEAAIGAAPAARTPGTSILQVGAGERLADSAGPTDLADVRRRLHGWRAAAAAMTAIAASLAAIVILDRLPPPTDEPGSYIAVVNRDGSLPALIVSVDTAAGLVTIRSLATERPTGRSLELWSIPNGQQPISLGVIDPNEPVTRVRPESADVIPTEGVFAVSVEPEGGSPTGAPTGPVVYSGALVKHLD